MKTDIKLPTKDEISNHQEYMCLQRREMLGEVNKYFAFMKMHRPVSDSEAIMYYIENGGAEDFFKRYGYLICPLSRQELN